MANEHYHAAPQEVINAIEGALRKPDCDHFHTTWPWADVNAILDAIRRAGYEIMPKSEDS